MRLPTNTENTILTFFVNCFYYLNLMFFVFQQRNLGINMFSIFLILQNFENRKQILKTRNPIDFSLDYPVLIVRKIIEWVFTFHDRLF